MCLFEGAAMDTYEYVHMNRAEQNLRKAIVELRRAKEHLEKANIDATVMELVILRVDVFSKEVLTQ